MSCYVTKSMASSALKQMCHFYGELKELYENHGLSITEDLGRRNILMSSLQEKYFAAELGKRFPGTTADGKTGEPDIRIPALNRELECKLTSKNKSGSWALQSDYNTLARKGAVDHLYLLANPDFNEFSVLFFKGLTTADFHPPAPGSKGKSRLNWAVALEKCTVVLGELNNKANDYISDCHQIINDPASSRVAKEKAAARIDYWSSRTNVVFSLEKI